MSAGVIAPLRALYPYYLLRQGYRDGSAWPVDAGRDAFYQFTSWAKLRERWERQKAEAHGG